MSVRGEPIEAPGKPGGQSASMAEAFAPPQESSLVAGQVAILERVALGAPLRDILEDSVRLCETLHPDMLASILLLDPDGVHLHHGAGPRLPEAYRAAIDGSPIGPAAGSCGTAAYRGEPVVVEDIASDPLWEQYRSVALPHGLRSCWSTPIFDADHKVLGTFAIYYRRTALPTPWHRRIIQVITHLASIAISKQGTEEALRRSAVERSLIFDRISDAFVALDKNWRYTHVNAKAGQFFARDPESLIGKHIWTEFPDGKGQRFHLAYEEAMATQRMIMLEEYYPPYGKWFENRIYPSPEGLTIYFHDITDRKRAEEALRRSHADLEKLVGERTAELERKNKELETFSYSVSHDLKAPLRGIDGYSKVLSDEYGPRLDEEGRRFLANIRQGAVQMHQLIEDMLAYARLDRRAPALGPVDLRAAVAAVSAERRYDLDRIAYSEDVASGKVIADREGLAMALRNLLDNAYKFSQKRPAPAISIASRVEGDRHILTVKDNGTGFSMKHHETIFQIFQRLHRSEEYGGTGVGLALVRKAMDRMGGRVWAESVPDQGASFHLDLARIAEPGSGKEENAA